MKNIGVAAELYQIMKDDARKAEAENERNLSAKSIGKEILYTERLWAFELGLEHAGVLDEVKEEWSKRYGHD